MSQPNFSLKRQLSGTSTIRGLNFAYRLNQWGPKVGPSLIAANDYPKGLTGVSGPITYIESLFGIESAQDTLNDAQERLDSSSQILNILATPIGTAQAQAQAYNSSSDQATLAKSQALQAHIAGLSATLENLKTAWQNIQTTVTALNGGPALDKTSAQTLKDQAGQLLDSAQALKDQVDALPKAVSDITSTASSGPGVTGYIENLVSSNVSKLTWILGGAAAVYFLAPTFIPRMARGLKKAL